MDWQEITDLAARALGGDTAAKTRLHAHYETRVVGYFAKHGLDGPDPAQETWKRVFAAAKPPRNFDAWLFGIACRVLIDATRASWNRPCQGRPDAEVQPPDCVLEQREIGDLVREAVHGLPEDLRAPMLMRYFDGKSCRDIADSLGTSEGAIASRLHRAREILRARLQGRV